MKPNQHDIQLIHKLGGPSKVAELLGLDKQGGAQRVQNWLTRGVPAQVKLDFPDIFLPERGQGVVSAQEPAALAPTTQLRDLSADARRHTTRREQDARPGDDRRQSGPPFLSLETGVA